MHVVWKRPDGFIGAVPEDYFVYYLDNQFGLWLHRADKNTYPFRISGTWQETEATHQLNNFVNLLPEADEVWVKYLVATYNQTMPDHPETFLNDVAKSFTELDGQAKGDHWEVEIITQTIRTILGRLAEIKAAFLAAVEKQNG